MTWKRSDKIALSSLVAAGISLAFSLVTLAPTVSHWYNDPTATISTPENNTRVTQQIIMVSGRTGGHIPSDDDLWLLVRPEDNHSFFPMERITRQEDGAWSVPADQVTLGGPGHYRIFVYLADGASSSELSNWMATAASQRNPNFPGLAQMPPGATMLSSVEIERID